MLSRLYVCDYGDFITPTYMAEMEMFLRETYGKTAIYDSSKNLPKKGRLQGFLSSGGWQYFPTQIETFLAHTSVTVK